MKRIDLERYKPLGYASMHMFTSAGVLILALIHTIELPSNIISARNRLYPEGRLVLGLIHGAKMPPYLSLIGDSFILFPLFWLFMGIEVISCYAYHRKHSMSIYLMRRLPDRWELHRRCWGRPLVFTAGSFLLMGLVLAFYFLVYLILTPAECLPF